MRSKLQLALLLLCGCAALATSTGAAQTTAPSASHEHGFYLRQHLGAVAQRSRFAPGGDPEHFGLGFAGGTAAGFALSEHWVLLAAFDNVSTAHAPDVVLSAYSLGAGAAYVWTEPRVYVSGAVGPAFGWYFDGVDERVHFTRLGVEFAAIAGKEWQIADLPFGLGVALLARYFVLPEGNVDAFGLALSGTYF